MVQVIVYASCLWFGVYVPAKTPKAVVDQLNAELVAILKLPEFVAWLRDQGLQPVADKPEQLKERLAKDVGAMGRCRQGCGHHAAMMTSKDAPRAK